MNVVFLGATRGMGRALARLMAERGDRLFLLGRDAHDLARSTADLAVRAGGGAAGRMAGRDGGASESPQERTASPIGTAYCDLLEPDGFPAAFNAADAALSTIDCVVVTAGLFAKQEDLEDDPAAVRRLLDVDFARTIEFCEEARRRLLASGGGTLCVFSSVAGERGRKPVVIYGAAKAGLTHYLEGLDHKFRTAGLKTICVKPGFVKTGMTADLDPPPFSGEPGDVAKRVLQAIDRGKPVVYAPAPWRWIMLVIRNLPRAIMRSIHF